MVAYHLQVAGACIDFTTAVFGTKDGQTAFGRAGHERVSMMHGFMLAIQVLAVSCAALVAFLLVRHYAAQRRSEVDAQVQRLEQLHSTFLDAQARHHEHIEQVMLNAHAHSHDQLARTIDAQHEHLDALLHSRADALTSQVSELLQAHTNDHRRAEEQFRRAIEQEIRTGLRGATQQVEIVRREFTDLARRMAPMPVGLAATHAPPKLPLSSTSQIVLGAEESPLVRITALASANDRAISSSPVVVTASAQRELGPVLSHAARALLGGAQAGQRHLKMVFSPEIAQGLQDGTLHMMRSRAVEGGIRAMAVDSLGTIRGQASLVKGLNPAAVAMGALQIMAVITAQQYLAVINRQLEQIQGGIQNIKDWLTNEVRGRVRGNSDQLRRMAQALDRHEVSELDREVYAHELQTIDREISQVLKQIEEERVRALKGFRHKAIEEKAFKADGLLGDSLKTVREKFVRELEPCQHTSELAILATRVRAMGILLRGALGLNQHHALDLAEELSREHYAALKDFNEWRQELEVEIGALKSRYRTATADSEVRASLQKALKERFFAVDTDGDEFRGVLLNISAALQQQIESTARPTEIEVTLDAEGQVVELRRAS